MGGTTTNFVKSSTLPSYRVGSRKRISKEINFAHHIAEFPRCLLSWAGSVSVCWTDLFCGPASRVWLYIHEQHAGYDPGPDGRGSGSPIPIADAFHVRSAAERAPAYV